MRRGFAIVAVVLLVLVGVGIGIGAYNVGFDHGVEQQLAESGQGVDVVRVVGDRDREGFFPFGLLFFPLLLFGVFALVRAATWRRWGGPGGPWKEHAQGHFDEWHRRQHEPGGAGTGSGAGTGAGAEPA